MANEVKVIVYMTTIIASGYALMKYTVPDEESMKKVCLLVHSSLYLLNVKLTLSLLALRSCFKKRIRHFKGS